MIIVLIAVLLAWFDLLNKGLSKDATWDKIEISQKEKLKLGAR